MKNFNVTPLQLHDARSNFRENDMELNYIAYRKKSYTEKFKHYLKKISLIIQKVILYTTFWYIPIYSILLYSKVIAFVSVLSVYFLIIYLLAIMTFVLINREENTSVK